MLTGSYTDLSNIKEGLEVLRGYVEDGAVVVRTYIVHVPDIVISNLSNPDWTTLQELGWRQHIVEGGVLYSLREEPRDYDD